MARTKCEEIENRRNRGNTEKSYNIIRMFLENPKLKIIITKQRNKNS